jgi:hypothetical protein
MANTSVYQSKNKRLVFDSEAAVGTAETLDASSLYIPAFDIAMSRDRGTQIIARDAVLDGFAGEMCGVPGSFGSSLSFSSEIHPVSGDNDIYFIRLLQACGWSGTTAGGAVTMHPSSETIQAYAGGASPSTPSSVTFGLVHIIDTIDDTMQAMTGSTGNVDFVFNAGERAQLDFSFVGLQGDFITNTADLSAIGSFTGVDCVPFVVKGITATMTGSVAGSDVIDVVELSGITLNSNASTPDTLDPTAADGFAVSPVFFNTAPTVSFQIAATSNNNTAFLQNFKAGRTIDITVSMAESTTSTSVALRMQQVQFTSISMEDRNGFESYSIEGKVVRDPGDDYNTAGSLLNFIWTY